MAQKPAPPDMEASTLDNKVTRSFDWFDLDFVVEKYKYTWINFDAQTLVENRDNILLQDSRGNYGLFEFDEPGIYFGHYMFRDRGFDNTLLVAENILDYLFQHSNAYLILGLTPVWHKGALTLNDALGLKEVSMINTPNGTHKIVSLTKEDFYDEFHLRRL